MPAARVRRSSGRSEIAACCRSLASSGPTSAGLPDRSADISRLSRTGGPVLPEREARCRAGGFTAAPAWVATPACLPAAHPDGRAADQAERHVAADGGGKLAQLGLAQAGPPQLVAGDKRGGGVG